MIGGRAVDGSVLGIVSNHIEGLGHPQDTARKRNTIALADQAEAEFPAPLWWAEDCNGPPLRFVPTVTGLASNGNVSI